MTEAAPSPRRFAAALLAGARSPTVLWAAFVLAHLWLGYLNLYAPGLPLGDVTFVYRFWAEQAAYSDFWVGIHSEWVYPIVALVPILAAGAFGFDLYPNTWLSLVMLLDCVAFAVLVGWDRSRLQLGWWWVAFLILLGPIAIGRIDSITVPIALIGLLLVASRPLLATVLLTIGAWIKVWPAAIIAAIVVASGARLRVLATAVASSVVIAAVALALGAGSNIFSFVGEQAGRGLQIEAPVSGIWLWQVYAGVPGAILYYDSGILTYQVVGPGSDAAAAVMTPLLVLAVATIGFLGIAAMRRGASTVDLLAPLALALVTALIAFNKVGSPQFMTWLAVPIILGMATRATGRGRSFRVPAVLTLILALLTQAVYPYLYFALLAVDPVMLVLLTTRNLLVFVLLGWAIASVLSLASASAEPADPSDGIQPPAASWPLRLRSES